MFLNLVQNIVGSVPAGYEYIEYQFAGFFFLMSFAIMFIFVCSIFWNIFGIIKN